MKEVKSVEFDKAMKEYNEYIRDWVNENNLDIVEAQLDIRGEEKDDGLINIYVRVKYFRELLDVENVMDYQKKLSDQLYKLTERIKSYKYLNCQAIC